MKKTLFLMVIMSIWCSCAKLQQTKLEDAAVAQMNNAVLSDETSGTDPKISNVRVVFQNDSVCVLHFDNEFANKLGHRKTKKMEYIYLVTDGNIYECLLSDSIFITEPAYNRDKEGTVYEHLSYDEGLNYLFIHELRQFGKNLTDQEGGIFVPSTLPVGDWEVKMVEDKFGNPTGEKYLSLRGTGTFENTYLQNKFLIVELSIRKNGLKYLTFYEYGGKEREKYAKAFDFFINTNSGNYHTYAKGQSDIVEYFSYDYFTYGYYNIEENKFKQLNKCLVSEEKIQCYARSVLVRMNEYRWTFDFTGYNEALKYIE